MTTLAAEDGLHVAADEQATAAALSVLAGALAEPAVSPLPPADVTIVRGAPTDIELAALLLALHQVLAPPAPLAEPPAETWGLPAQLHRSGTPLSPHAYTALRG